MNAYPVWIYKNKGLTQSEVDARHAAGSTFPQERGPTIRELVRKYVLTIFNLGLLSLIILQLLFQKPLDALVSALLMVVGISISVGQELWARRRLARITAERRETVTVIRNGAVDRIELPELVIDDVIFAGQEDLISADGVVIGEDQFLIDESFTTDNPDPVLKAEGDQVFTGSICLAGSGTYRVVNLPQNSLAFHKLQEIENQPKDYSPLQKLIDRVLRALIVIVTYFGVLLILDYALVEANVLNHSAMAAMIFGLAPNGLFFMIILSYTMGVTMISGRGALIPNITDIEALAQVSVLCLGKTGALTHVNVDIEPISSQAGVTPLSTGDLKRLVGDYSRSISTQPRVLQALAEALPGVKRSVVREIPLALETGWSGIIFQDDTWQNLYILGVKELLVPNLVADLSENKNQSRQIQPGRMAGLIDRVSKLFQSTKQTSQKVISTLMFGNQVDLLLATAQGDSIKYDDGGNPLLPELLVPLGEIKLSEEIRSDAREMIDFFTNAGVSIKLLSDDDPEDVINFAKQVGIYPPDDEPIDLISGEQLREMNRLSFSQAVKVNTIFSRLSPEQKGFVIQALRDQGEFVGMLGSSIHDLQALKNANIWITPESGSQAIRRLADIVMLKNSLATLRFVFREGERIINGLSDVFRVYLTQILYFAILIVTIGILDLGFPLSGKQNSAVTLVTVHIPAMALSIFAFPGKTPRGKLVDMLIHFIVPAGILTSIAGFSIYFYFLVSTNDLNYAQLAMTHILVFCGALTILFIEPPLPFFAGGDIYRGNKWPAVVVIVLVVIFLILTPTWLGKELFDLQPLRKFRDYLIILATAVAFGLILKSIWQINVFDRYMRIDLDESLDS
jgi:cation-transporting ATPase E